MKFLPKTNIFYYCQQKQFKQQYRLYMYMYNGLSKGKLWLNDGCLKKGQVTQQYPYSGQLFLLLHQNKIKNQFT